MKNIVAPLIKTTHTIERYLLFKDGEYIQPFLEEKFRYNETAIMTIENLLKNESYSLSISKDFKRFAEFKNFISPSNSIDFKGKIYLLVDSNVYSSAEAFSVFAKDKKLATLIGATTGGDGINLDPALASMPNSGLIFRFPLSMGLNPDGTPNEETHTQPDIYIEQASIDIEKYMEWAKNNPTKIINPYDTVINKLLEMIK